MVNIISRPQRSLEGSPCIGWLLSSSSLSSSHIRFHCHGFKCHYHNRHCHCHHYHYFIRVMRKQTQTDFFLLQYIFVEIWREPLFTHIYVFHSFYKSRNFEEKKSEFLKSGRENKILRFPHLNYAFTICIAFGIQDLY